jgi:MFS family permease
MQLSRPDPLLLVLLGGAIMGLALGARHVQGLFLIPLTTTHGWSRSDFAFALALQNLVWGLAQPFTGMIADRFGSVRVIFGGCLLYGFGLYCMSQATTSGQFVVSAGLLVGVALSCTSFGAVYGALSRILPAERRGWGLGLAGAAGGLGQFMSVPVAQSALGSMGPVDTLVMLAIAMTVLSVFAFPLNDRNGIGESSSPPQTMRSVLRAARAHKGFWMLGIGFLACGFQLAFIATHLPAYLLDRGLGGQSAMIALALIAMANVAGTYACGLLGNLVRKAQLLAWVYLARSLAIACFVMLPLSEATLYVFSFIMGLLWLGTVPLTSGVVAQIFGVRYLATLFGFVFFGHQVGSFLGVWLGGLVFDATGSYDAVWYGAVAVGLAAALLHWPIQETAVPAPAEQPA